MLGFQLGRIFSTACTHQSMSYHRKTGSGGRDLGLSSNGKGSACRITDNRAFAENFDAIDWGRKKKNRRKGWRALEGNEVLEAADEYLCLPTGDWARTSYAGKKAQVSNFYFRKL